MVWGPEKDSVNTQFAQLKSSEFYKTAIRSSAAIAKAKSDALEVFEDVILTLGEFHTNNFIQNSPMRLNVWRRFADDPNGKIKLIITPNHNADIALVHKTLTSRLSVREKTPNILVLSNTVLVAVNLNEACGSLLKETVWWQRHHSCVNERWKKLFESDEPKLLPEVIVNLLNSEEIEVIRIIAAWAIILSAEESAFNAFSRNKEIGPEYIELQRWSTIKRFSAILFEITTNYETITSPQHLEKFLSLSDVKSDGLGLFFRHFFELLLGFVESENANEIRTRSYFAPIWSIDVNRDVELAISQSRKTIKADAAERLFNEDAKKITWAIIDSGIDASHIGFKNRERSDNETVLNSRVKETFDFTRLRLLFEQNYAGLVDQNVLANLENELKSNAAPKITLDEAVICHLFRIHWEEKKKSLSQRGTLELINSDDSFRLEVLEYLEDVKRKVRNGLLTDWTLIEPIIKISHIKSEYRKPINPHGTHVAGILGSDIRPDEIKSLDIANDHYVTPASLQGICPNIRLIDLRVCDENGVGEEFLVLAALQFVSYCNRSRETPLVHGVNLSLSIRHEIRNYACGQTPVCRDSNKLVSEGIVVVAAAGNTGFQKQNSKLGLIDRYNAVSITDPGNAEHVITVGSTYRKEPHKFGISYFSSRGPTGDGRQKPDIIAPGERILSTIPDNGLASKHGTSMAAPHVSGASAILMSRHTELVGQPLKIKSILCETATDIGRTKEFQGNGLVDVLRALQSF